MTMSTAPSRPAHTPGPWSVGPLPIINGKYAGCYAISPSAGPAFAVMIGGGPADIRAANARLIAAAPELLNVAQAIIHGLYMGLAADEILRESGSVRESLIAAIAKATEGQP